METWGDIFNIATLFAVIFFGFWIVGIIQHKSYPAKRAFKVAALTIIAGYVVVGVAILLS